jgi:hypothetical protein
VPFQKDLSESVRKFITPSHEILFRYLLSMSKSEIPAAPVFSRQLHLPIFPAEGIMLGEQISVVNRDGTVYYFHYDLPIFSHGADDLAMFRMFTSSLCDKGVCRLVEVQRAFMISSISVKRALKQYREEGPESFFRTKHHGTKPRILVGECLEEVQGLLDEGLPPRAIEERTGVKADTIRRAIQGGRLHRPKKGGPQIG